MNKQLALVDVVNAMRSAGQTYGLACTNLAKDAAKDTLRCFTEEWA